MPREDGLTQWPVEFLFEWEFRGVSMGILQQTTLYKDVAEYNCLFVG